MKGAEFIVRKDHMGYAFDIKIGDIIICRSNTYHTEERCLDRIKIINSSNAENIIKKY